MKSRYTSGLKEGEESSSERLFRPRTEDRCFHNILELLVWLEIFCSQYWHSLSLKSICMLLRDVAHADLSSIRPLLLNFFSSRRAVRLASLHDLSNHGEFGWYRLRTFRMGTTIDDITERSVVDIKKVLHRFVLHHNEITTQWTLHQGILELISIVVLPPTSWDDWVYWPLVIEWDGECYDPVIREARRINFDIPHLTIWPY